MKSDNAKRATKASDTILHYEPDEDVEPGWGGEAFDALMSPWAGGKNLRRVPWPGSPQEEYERRIRQKPERHEPSRRLALASAMMKGRR